MNQLASPRKARRIVFAAAALLALAVAACSTSATTAPSAAETVAAATASPTATATPTPTPTVAPTDTPTPTATATPTPTAKPTPHVTPLPALAIGLCRGTQLKLTITSWQFDGSSAYAHVTAQNVSSASCNMRGTSRARMLNRYGSVIADAGTSAAKVVVSDATYPLSPGDSINTIVKWANWCKSAPAQKVTVQMVQPFGLGTFKAAANGNAPIPTCYASGSKTTVSSEKWLP